ncbi:MAG: LPS export ABC transporter periplasmic protein LptC [bacterium]|nr:MAG: LPS export ABC transporter periplasmic protein LptC [bacterium]
MTGFRITQETVNGRWEIRAVKATYDAQGDVLLQEVSARMLSNGFERVTVISDKGRFEASRLVLHLEGNVIVASGLGSRLETPELQWNGADAVMVAGGGVRLKRLGLEVLGKSARYRIDSGMAMVSGGVRTTLDSRSNRP